MDLLVPCIVEGRSELRNAGRVNCKTSSVHDGRGLQGGANKRACQIASTSLARKPRRERSLEGTGQDRTVGRKNYLRHGIAER
jgi:hypothetical protein